MILKGELIIRKLIDAYRALKINAMHLIIDVYIDYKRCSHFASTS